MFVCFFVQVKNEVSFHLSSLVHSDLFICFFMIIPVPDSSTEPYPYFNYLNYKHFLVISALLNLCLISKH